MSSFSSMLKANAEKKRKEKRKKEQENNYSVVDQGQPQPGEVVGDKAIETVGVESKSQCSSGGSRNGLDNSSMLADSSNIIRSPTETATAADNFTGLNYSYVEQESTNFLNLSVPSVKPDALLDDSFSSTRGELFAGVVSPPLVHHHDYTNFYPRSCTTATPPPIGGSNIPTNDASGSSSSKTSATTVEDQGATSSASTSSACPATTTTKLPLQQGSEAVRNYPPYPEFGHEDFSVSYDTIGDYSYMEKYHYYDARYGYETSEQQEKRSQQIRESLRREKMQEMESASGQGGVGAAILMPKQDRDDPHGAPGYFYDFYAQEISAPQPLDDEDEFGKDHGIRRKTTTSSCSSGACEDDVVRPDINFYLQHEYERFYRSTTPRDHDEPSSSRGAGKNSGDHTTTPSTKISSGRTSAALVSKKEKKAAKEKKSKK
ncbi:unnamed protein product [Amoebophrya sp. A120]|nr:unnamed protein product [Amoebophrya sp. A120]|eukprot:GSA120T00014418001.1